ncbi:MAG: MoaD/ThiS family protein [Abitibacteriaceae bacterium]|nr:MoaD/ThiS family protein [Abditibacteriaceae bacterium]MBV9866328.1 MoaD/ThiS family protein [Abditibacteriaceae bacterium]
MNHSNASQVEPLKQIEMPVLLFASLKDAAGSDQIMVRLSYPSATPMTVQDFLAQCGQQYPAIAAWLPHVRVAVNCTYADAQQTLTPGDEIALLPPVSGGTL